MCFLDGYPLRRRTAPQLPYDGGFEVADKKLRHGQELIALIACVKRLRNGAK